jgi:hypothetical protein
MGPPKQEKGHCVRTRNSQVFSLYNIEKGEFFLRKTFSLQGCKDKRNPFPSEWEVWKRFLQNLVSFSNMEKTYFSSFFLYQVSR